MQCKMSACIGICALGDAISQALMMTALHTAAELCINWVSRSVYRDKQRVHYDTEFGNTHAAAPGETILLGDVFVHINQCIQSLFVTIHC